MIFKSSPSLQISSLLLCLFQLSCASHTPFDEQADASRDADIDDGDADTERVTGDDSDVRPRGESGSGGGDLPCTTWTEFRCENGSFDHDEGGVCVATATCESGLMNLSFSCNPSGPCFYGCWSPGGEQILLSFDDLFLSWVSPDPDQIDCCDIFSDLGNLGIVCPQDEL